MKPKAKTTKVNEKKHDVRSGACVACHRRGADLNTPCPGYATAAEVFDRKVKSTIDPLTTGPRAAPPARMKKGGRR